MRQCFTLQSPSPYLVLSWPNSLLSKSTTSIPIFSTMSGNDQNSFLYQNYFLFVTVGSAALIVTIYHCIIVICRGQQQRTDPLPQQATVLKLVDIQNNIPIHKYEMGKGSNGRECSICLSEFEEGDELRTLPQCMHSFHVACIDMWLYSHPNCPMCRTNAVRCSPRAGATVPGQALDLSDSDLDGDARRLDSSMSQNLGMQHLPV